MMKTIHKAAGIIIQQKKLLVTRCHNETIFIAPGGQVEAGESAPEALVRELAEEVAVAVDEKDLVFFGSFQAEAATRPGVVVRMDVYTVQAYRGTLRPNSEIEELRWIDSADLGTIEVGSVFAHEVVPRLKVQGLIG